MRPSVDTAAPTGRAFRPDIAGLRAVAVVLVVLYHAHVPGITGGYVGVDVFFVISGYLITGQLTRQVARAGRIHFIDFYLRRVRRLLPAAALVVVVTLVAARFLAPPLQTRSLAKDALYTVVYGLNYRLAAKGIDYQQASGPVSPLQHYWSLAVEEQYYLVWPVLIMVVVLLARQRWRQVLPAALVVGALCSFAVSVTLLRGNAPLAYFSLQSRAWELAAGALVALAARRLAALPFRLAGVLAWAGLVLIVAGGFVYTDSTSFPGVHALVPVVGAALLIAAGCGPRAAGPEVTLLRRRSFQEVGNVSYSWYLWHYPVLILAPFVAPDHTFGWRLDLLLMLVALGLAVATHRWLEQPVLAGTFRWPVWLGWGALTSAATAGVAALVLLTGASLVGTGAPVTIFSGSGPATPAYVSRVVSAVEAAALTQVVPANLTPTLATAAADQPATTTSAQNCHANFLVVDQGPCVYGDPAGTKTVVLFGDSHMEQWQPAFDVAGQREHWKVVSWTKSSCPAADVTYVNSDLHRTYTECDTWRALTIARIIALKPDLVVVGQSDETIGTLLSDGDWAARSVSVVRDLAASGARVDFMMDTVYPATDVPGCVSAHLHDVPACEPTAGRQAYLIARHGVVAAAMRAAGITAVEPQPWTCLPGGYGVCPVILGDMLVYRDNSHLSATYSRWLAPLVEPLLTRGA